MMTRKHYRAIAADLAESGPSMPADDYRLLVARLASTFKDDNRNFSIEKFTDACYVEGEDLRTRAAIRESEQAEVDPHQDLDDRDAMGDDYPADPFAGITDVKTNDPWDGS